MKLLKRFSLFEILLIATIMGIHIYAATADAYNFPNTWFIRDDAYYYFKVAQNITQGLGSTFDGINRTNGYHPLWLLINIPIFYFARFDLILPLRILLMVVAIFNAATAVLIYRIISRSLSNAVAMFAASYWAFSGYIQYAFYRPGLESPLAMFAIVLFIERLGAFETTWRAKTVTSKQISALALIAVMVMFSRLDLIFLAVIAGIYIVFRGHPIRFLLPFDIVIIFLSMTSSVLLRVNFPAYNSYAAFVVNAVVVALAIKPIAFYFAGLYQHPKMKTAWELIRQTAIASTISSILFSGAMLLYMQVSSAESFPRIALVFDWLISFGLILILRFAVLWFGNNKINVNLSTPNPLTELRLNWKMWLTDGWIYYRVVGGALAVYMLYNKIVFGTSSPVSGQIKRWWGTLSHTVYDQPASSWSDFFGVGFGNAYDAWQPLSHTIRWLAVLAKPLYRGANTEDERYYIVMGALTLILFLILFFNARRTLCAFSKMALIPLLASSGIQALSYTATAYGGAKEWYWTGQALLTVFILSIAADFILRPFQRYKPFRFTFEILSAIAGIYFVVMMSGFIVVNMPHGRFAAADRPYMDVVAYLENNTRPHSVIGMTGGGNVGYFIKDRTIINMDGLINSYDYFQALKQKEAPAYLYQHGMRIVFSNTKLLTYSPYDDQFTPYLSTFNVYGGKNLMWLLREPKKWLN